MDADLTTTQAGWDRSGVLWFVLAAVGIVGLVWASIVGEGPLLRAVVTLGGAAAVGTCLLAAVRRRPRWPGLWFGIATAVAVVTSGTAIDYFDSRSFLGTPIRVGEVWDVAAYLTILGLIATVLIRREGAGAHQSILDLAVVSIAWFSIEWFARRTIVPAGHDPTQFWVAVVFTGFDSLLMLAILRIASREALRMPSYQLLVVAAGLIGSTDVAWIRPEGDPARMWGHVILGAALWTVALAAAHPSMTEVVLDESGWMERLQRGRVFTLGLVLVVPAVLLLIGGSRIDSATGGVLAVAAAVAVALVVVRLAGIVQLVQQQGEQVAGLARTDALTGLPNRRTVDAELTRAASRAAARGDALVVAMLDLDHFKAYNDLRGHAAGDRLLATATTAWRAAIPAGAFLGRFGGEEFVIITRGSDIGQVATLVDALRAPGSVAFSAGVAAWDGVEPTGMVVGRADAALYAAKDAGRGRTMMITAPGAAPVAPFARLVDQT